MKPWLNAIWKWIKNKEHLYTSIILIFFVLAIWYGWRGYNYYTSVEAVKNGNDLMSRLFTPFVLATIRFVIVMLLGVFVAMNVIANPLKRIKVMQFEVEFAEIAKVQEKQLNQFHFISTVLKENMYFIGQASNYTGPGIPFNSTIQEILTQYELFFDTELSINIDAQVCLYQSGSLCFQNPEYNRMAEKLIAEPNPDKRMAVRKKITGNPNYMMAVSKEFGEINIVLIESKEHNFTDYDKEVMKCIFEYSENVCTLYSLLP